MEEINNQYNKQLIIQIFQNICNNHKKKRVYKIQILIINVQKLNLIFIRLLKRKTK